MRTILLIEDSEDIRETTAEILELAGYKVLLAENGKIGVEFALLEKPDLVICDIMMPVLDGYGTLYIFLQNPSLQNIPFIFLTAKTDRSDIRKGMEMGADDFLTKPFKEIELLNAIESRLKKLDNLTKSLSNTQDDLELFYKSSSNHADINALSNDRKISKVKKKQLVYAEGDEPIKFYFLKSGKIKTYQINDDGKEFIIDLYKSGDFFGHIAIIENTEYNESAEAMEDCEIIGIPKNDFVELITRNQLVANGFIKLLANNIHSKENQLSQMAYNTLRKRTASCLVMLFKKYKNENEENFAIKISRDDLASLVGTATESLIRTLSEFKSDKLIEIIGGEIKIIELKKLESLRG